MTLRHQAGENEGVARPVPKWQRVERLEQSKIEAPRNTPTEAEQWPGFRGETIPEREEKFCHVK
jgi:hypothetical protein